MSPDNPLKQIAINKSCKSKSSVTKLEFDLYYVKLIYIQKFISISEKSA